MDDPLADDCCSVCRSSFNIPCQANCSHWFCGNCIMEVWHHSSTIQPCKCPLCRRQITLLVPGEASLRRHHDPEVAEIKRKVQTYNRLFGGRSNGLIQRMQDLPFLLRRLLRELMDPQRSLPLVIRARVYIAMILSAVYVLSPVDIIPEGIVGIVGLLDDLLIVLICFLHVAAMYRSVLYFRHGGS
nr:E3 ubiquitin-protein ligase RNF170-like [Quercus suber]POE65437.1 e3 ubiquitin-protein ligase [Quercus suber]